MKSYNFPYVLSAVSSNPLFNPLAMILSVIRQTPLPTFPETASSLPASSFR